MALAALLLGSRISVSRGPCNGNHADKETVNNSVVVLVNFFLSITRNDRNISKQIKYVQLVLVREPRHTWVIKLPRGLHIKRNASNKCAHTYVTKSFGLKLI